MIHAGSILVIGADVASSIEVCRSLRGLGYDARHAANKADAVASFAAERHDVVLIRADSATQAVDIAAALRADDQRPTPIAVTPTGPGRGFDVNAVLASCDDYVAPPLYDAKLLAHLRPLVRLATIRTEVALRLAVARQFGVEAPSRGAEDPAEEAIRALVVGNPGALQAAFSGVGIEVISDPLFAIDALHKSPFDLAVIAADVRAADADDLCLRIRSSPSLFNLPVLSVGNAARRHEGTAYDHGVSDYIDAASDESSILARAGALVRRYKVRRTLGRMLAATLTDSTRGTSRAYSPEFLEAYLPERFDFAQRYGHHLTLVSVHSADVEKARRQYGEEQAGDLRRSLSEWIAHLTRVEDLVAARTDQEFVVVLPDTPRSEAAQVTARLAAIIGHVEFALTEVYEAVRVSVGVSGADLAPGETLDAFIARARHEQL